METFDWLIKAALFFLGIQYLVGPILIWWKQTFPEKYKFNLLNSEAFLADQSDTFLMLHHEILRNYFHYVGSSTLGLSNSTTCFSIYYNATLKLTCTLSSIYNQVANTTQIEFTQLYEDGHVININNNPIFGIYPNWHKKVSYRFPDINSFTQLLESAKKLIAASGIKANKLSLERGTEFSIIEEHLNEELFRLIAAGWVSKTVSNCERRATPIGALLMTWQLCWPVKYVLGARDEKNSINALENA